MNFFGISHDYFADYTIASVCKPAMMCLICNEIKELGEIHSGMLYHQNSSSFPIYQATQLIISDL